MGKDESELVPMNKEPGYGGTDAEESKKPAIAISDFKPAAPTWVLDGSLRAIPATQVMVHVMDKDSHKWIPTYISYTCKAIAVIIA